MNKRIAELAEQAMELVDPYALEGEFGPKRLNEEKFAELIVQECLMKVNGAKIRNESYAELIERIKEDFGVEE